MKFENRSWCELIVKSKEISKLFNWLHFLLFSTRNESKIMFIDWSQAIISVNPFKKILFFFIKKNVFNSREMWWGKIETFSPLQDFYQLSSYNLWVNFTFSHTQKTINYWHTIGMMSSIYRVRRWVKLEGVAHVYFDASTQQH